VESCCRPMKLRFTMHARRRRFRFIALCCMSGLLASCAGGPGAHPEEKSVFVGELIAIFPGFFVHGLGHRYAGNTEKANEILVMEAYSLLTAGLGGGLLALGHSEDAEAVEIAGWVGIGAGGVGFLGTWIYDILFTPGQIEEHNKLLRGD
jgi:hypothetical protein